MPSPELTPIRVPPFPVLGGVARVLEWSNAGGRICGISLRIGAGKSDLGGGNEPFGLPFQKFDRSLDGEGGLNPRPDFACSRI